MRVPLKCRRGVAMLLVLLTLVVAVAAAVNVARMSVTGIAAERLSEHQRFAADLLAQGESAATGWLQTESRGVALPPDALTPSLTILHDSLLIGDQQSTICITAVDLTGMVPISALRNGSVLASAIPGDVAAAIRDAVAPFGPDQLADGDAHRRVYPRHKPAEQRVFGGGALDSGPDVPEEPNGEVAVTELVAFMTPTPLGRRETQEASPVMLNVNTTPLPLLTRALALSGIDALDQIVAARETGAPASLELTIGDDAPIRFTSSSPLWAFRIDAKCNSVTRSTWSVFEQRGGSWQLVRRIMIHEG